MSDRFTINCDLNKIYFAFPFEYFDKLLRRSGVSDELIANNRFILDQGGSFPSLPIFFHESAGIDLKYISNKFDRMLSKEKYIRAGFKEHKNELILLALLARDYYWLDDYGIPIGEYRTLQLNRSKLTGEEERARRTKKKVKLQDLNTSNLNFIRLQDTAKQIKLLIDYHEHNRDCCLQVIFKNYTCPIMDKRMVTAIIKGIEETLLNSTPCEIGEGIGLVMQYEECKEKNDFKSLKKLITKMLDHNPFISPNPPINEAIARISVDIREYLLHHGLIVKNKQWQALLIQFLDEVFELLEIKHSIYDTSSSCSHAALATILKGFLKRF